jgi:hypothetical protein
LKTLVFQSYRADTPEWLARCMGSVREWCGLRNYEYRFIGDEIFEILPAWFLEAYRGRILPLTDLARALCARRFLDEGWERAIWVDADVLIFLPQRFEVSTEHGYALCMELWCEKKWGELVLDRRVNNCISVYDQGNAFLPFYIEAMQSLARAKGATLTDWDIGTNFLSTLGRIMPLALLGNVAMLSPTLVSALATHDAGLLRRYSREMRQACGATNLCGSALERAGAERANREQQLNEAIDLLLRTQGEALNRYLEA